MSNRSAASLFVAVLLSAGAADAATLPAIKTSADNEVPACATPGRLNAFIKARNGALDPRFENVAVAYMRYGEELGIRWDYAFFQMLLETGNLSYKRGNGRPGDVRSAQNNFAGLGATGNGASGESFPDIATGVKAHLQHVLMYSGERIAEPVADRTRKVQEWGVLTSWQKSFKGPITFSDLGKKWAPGDGAYARNIETIAMRFYDEYCERPDPAPQLVQEARSEQQRANRTPGDRVSGVELAKRAIERAKAEGDNTRSSLGAANLAKDGAVVKGGAEAQASRGGETQGPNSATGDRSPLQTASAGTAARHTGAAKNAPQRSAGKCRVFTASYGGQKSLIIKAQSEQFINYTVLDVNEGSEAREIEAYIAAYAKGGQKVAEFSDQTQALDKAFELCPEG